MGQDWRNEARNKPAIPERVGDSRKWGIRFRKRIVPERGEFRRGFVLKIPGNEWEAGVGDWAPTRDAARAGPERELRNDLISFMERG